MRRLLVGLLFLVTSCASAQQQEGFFVIEGSITLSTYQALIKGIDTGKVTGVELRNSPGGEVYYEEVGNKYYFHHLDIIRKANLPMQVTGTCKSACAAIALQGSRVLITGAGQLCLHMARMYNRVSIYSFGYYEGIYPGVSIDLVGKTFKAAPEVYCLSSMELKTVDKQINIW